MGDRLSAVFSTGFFQPGEFEAFALGDVEFGDGFGFAAHVGEELGALGDADRTARVEQVEGVALAQHKIVGRNRQAAGDTGSGLRLVDVEQAL